MGRLQSIENALTEINESVFQELCDSFLMLKYSNYQTFSRAGSQAGKQKTRKGTPDSFFLLPSGKYVFIEHSTNVSSGVGKLEEDILKCIDEEKTGISVEDIEEIVICTNFKIKTNDIENLKSSLPNDDISLTVYTIDSLAMELYRNHRDLVHEYLGLALDTGQVVSIERFIKEYDTAANGIATSLNNKFMHREREMKEIEDALGTTDFVILSGKPGVGKTKLALETIKKFLNNHTEYTAYCISNKNAELLDDLYQYFDAKKKYILFVDDANRLDTFRQITGFLTTREKGQVKVILTVRDYAYQQLSYLCQDFVPIQIVINKLEDEQIINILEAEPLEVLNSKYQQAIVNIADGNPRLAIMAALLAIEKQSIESLSDVSDLFEKYYSTFVKDQERFSEKNILGCLGLIAFFNVLSLKNREELELVLRVFDIDYYEFIEAIHELENMEIVEIQYKHVKIAEQNLATYYFYKCFIKDDLLSFEKLLYNFFESNRQNFIDTVIPSNNTFGSQRVMNKLRPVLKKYWNSIKNESDRENTFNFILTFWFYLQEEALEYVYIRGEKLQEEKTPLYQVTYKDTEFNYRKNQDIEIVGNLFRIIDKLENTLELSFELIKKQPQHLPELIKKIRDVLVYDIDDERTGFARQHILFDFFTLKIKENSQLYLLSFLELSKTFLDFRYSHAKGIRGNKVSWYEYHLPDAEFVYSLREKIWSGLNKCFSIVPDLTFEVLKTYNDYGFRIERKMVNYESTFLIQIINENLDPNSLLHCVYVNEQISTWKSNGIQGNDFNELTERFNSDIYKTFLKINWDRIKDMEILDFDDYEKYPELKIAELKSSFIFNSQEEAENFYIDFIFISKNIKVQHQINRSLDYILFENFKNNAKIADHLLGLIINEKNTINFIPSIFLRSIEKNQENIDRIQSLIVDKEFNYKLSWLFKLYEGIDTSIIDSLIIQNILDGIKGIDKNISVNLEEIIKILEHSPEILVEILILINKKNEQKEVEISIEDNLFEMSFVNLDSDIKVYEEVYLQQVKISDHFDDRRKVLLKILKLDPLFLVEWTKNEIELKESHWRNGQISLGFIWEIDGIEKSVCEAFEVVIEEVTYFSFQEHFCQVFFKGIDSNYVYKARDFLKDYMQKNIGNSEKLNIVFEVSKAINTDFFEEIMLSYLSLEPTLEDFRKVRWVNSGGVYSGEVIFGEIEAAQWREIQKIIFKSKAGYRLIPIKKYVNDIIESHLSLAEKEREKRFIRRE